MGILQTGSATAGSSSASSASITHGLTINSGDVVVAYIARNNPTSVIELQGASGGATWTDERQEDGPGTSRYSLQYVIANNAEPATYTWVLNTTTRYAVHLRVFSGVDGTNPIDVASVLNAGAASTAHVASSISVAAGSVGIVFSTADFGGNSFTAVDNSYTDLLYNTNHHSGSAYRIHASAGATGATTLTSQITKAYEALHIAFAEAAAGGTTYSVSFSGAVDLTDTQAANARAAASLAEPVDPADSYSSLLSTLQSVSAPVDLAESSIGAATVARSLTETVDLSDTQSAVIVQAVSLSETVDMADSYTSLSRAVAAITAAADFGETWAVTAVRIAGMSGQVDLADVWVGALRSVQVSITSNVDLAAATVATVRAAASLSEPVDFTDVQSALMTAGMSFTEAATFTDQWAAAAGEIAAAVRIIAAARDRRIVAEPRDRLVIVKARNRRIIASKLN